MSGLLSNQQKTYLSWLLTKQSADNSIDSLASTLIDSQVDLNPHQVDAALFAFKNPLSQGVLLADEVGLGKTIEAGLVIAQTWAERKKRILIITPANLRKQWYQELYDKFGLKAVIFEAKIYNQLKKEGNTKPFIQDEIIICSYQFAKSKANDIKNIAWDLVVIDEAHRLRNVYKKQNITANVIKQSLAHVHNKVLLTATPLQNSLLELYGLVSILDERVFGDLESFKSQFITGDKEVTLPQLRARLATVCKRTLRQQVQPFVSYTARRAIVQDFTPSKEEQQLRELVADYLRRPNLQALPVGQKQLISLVLWKLLASSTQAIAGALATMTTRLEKNCLIKILIFWMS
ncbi:DEAD/DEAH box helicase [Acinetobacter soli]|nr:DEAD/DEAH box helicase [Acinetobacter soli]WEI12975.1 DEAD/DEAH box helicase [Acinetobacter soli]